MLPNTTQVEGHHKNHIYPNKYTGPVPVSACGFGMSIGRVTEVQSILQNTAKQLQ